MERVEGEDASNLQQSGAAERLKTLVEFLAWTDSISFTTIDSNIITTRYLNSSWVNNVTLHQPRIARLNRSRQY
jgi:hypothetical protein